MTRTKRKLLALAVVLPLALAACTSDDDDDGDAASETGGGGAGTYGYTFAVVTHGSAGDAFWDVVKRGAEKAAADEGVTVNYQSDGDPQRQSQLIDAAVNENVDGLVVSMANPDAVRASIEAAVAAGIPVITINSGQDRSAEFGALAHVGQDEVIAGRGAGERMRDAGVTNAICVIHEAGNVGLEQRCQGFTEGLGGSVESLQVNISDLAAAQATIRAKLQEDSSINGVLTLNPGVGNAAVAAIDEAGTDTQLATFDLNEDVTAAVSDGSILFAVDQQQYVQGYLPIVMLTLYGSNLNTIGGGEPVLTGPGYVTQENADQVAELAAQGTR
jgi:simple sugar transport system substrate-binding protein